MVVHQTGMLKLLLTTCFYFLPTNPPESGWTLQSEHLFWEYSFLENKWLNNCSDFRMKWTFRQHFLFICLHGGSCLVNDCTLYIYLWVRASLYLFGVLNAPQRVTRPWSCEEDRCYFLFIIYNQHHTVRQVRFISLLLGSHVWLLKSNVPKLKQRFFE